MNIEALRDRHHRKTAYIVGRGPSLLRLQPKHFGHENGPVIALNKAILEVRNLDLPNPIYTMQKDGCRPSGVLNRRCGGCPEGHMIQPLSPETLLVHNAESPRCFADYPNRYVFDVEHDFGRPWHRPSAPVAVMIAKLMGCTGFVMLAHDAYVNGDDRRVEPGVGLVADVGYQVNGIMADYERGLLPMKWVSPE